MVDLRKSGLMSQHTRATLMICLAVIAVVAGGFWIWWQYIAPSTSRYLPVIAMIEQNKLALDRPGHADLTSQYPGVTPHNEMMLTRRDDGSFLALFPVKYGEGSQLSGLMYTSRPLREEDTYFRSSPMHISDRMIDVGPYGGLRIDDRVDPHWYHVSYRIR